MNNSFTSNKVKNKWLVKSAICLVLLAVLIPLLIPAKPVMAEEKSNLCPLSFLQIFQKLPSAFSGTDQIKFTSEPEDALVFVDNDLDDEFEERVIPGDMGRIVIPSIGTNSPLFVDTASFLMLLDWGSGLVPISIGESEEYIDSVYIHRVLSETTGVMYMQELKEGDPFYVDNYLTGIRYIYHIDRVETISREKYYERHPYYGENYNYGPMLGTEMVLVTCGPLIYGADDERILAYSSTSSDKVVQIPEDDPGYMRYKEINGLD